MALAAAGVALGAAAPTAAAHAGPGARLPSHPGSVRHFSGPLPGLKAGSLVAPGDTGDKGVVGDLGEFTGPLAQVWSIGAVPAVGSVGGLMGGGKS
ncbi:hypothetical protein AQI88_22795 [Streptomyces cellostaticus]|uniref:Uncharacterized protein n=1 Tax=Streptomyces cellostaticus TaxID=67285 RepID=A0A117PVJ4_9ACTN|nr:hypothetical protein AQI88_22795 [Streptomyces cellostaticus]